MDHTRDRLLDAAEALLAEKGPEGLALREVARRVGITPMAVYRHFDGLDALKSALRERAGAVLLAMLTEALGEPDARSRLEATARGYVRFATEKPASFRLMFTGGPPPAEAARAVEVRRNASAARFMADRVREAMDAGVLPRDDVEARTIDLWALLHGLVTLQQEGKLRLEPSKFDEHLSSTLRWILR